MPIRIVTLPGLRILASTGEVTALAGSRQSRALLVYVGIERSASRDTLLALLWPERDEARARHSLSQTLYEVRQAIGEECLRVTGDAVIACDELGTDLAAFEAAVEGGRWADALELYGGGFLEGVHLATTHPFEEWLDRRRAQVARLHRRARREVVTARLGASDLSGALAVAQRWAELEPLDDEAQQHTIELLARTGHRTEALAQYERFRERLRKEELEPMPELTQLAAQIAAGGPNTAWVTPPASLPRTESAAASARPDADRTPPASGEAAAAPPGANRAQGPLPAGAGSIGAAGGAAGRAGPLLGALRRHLRLALGATAAVALVLAGWLGWLARRAPEAGAALTAAAAQPANHVAVLYFQDLSPGGDDRHLAVALTESLIGRLGAVSALTVISSAGVERLRDRHPPLDSIGRALGVGTLVTGSILREGDSIRVSAQLVDARTASILDQTQVERRETQLFALVDEVVREVSLFLRRRVGAAVQVQRWQSSTPSQEAWQLVQRATEVRHDARTLEHEGAIKAAFVVLRRADSLLAQAGRKDPKWNVPLVERARTEELLAYAYLGPWPDRDPVKGQVAFERGIAHTTRALERDPDDADAQEVRGVLRFWRWMLFTRTAPDSAAARKAAEADLVSAVAHDARLNRAWSTLSALRFQAVDYAGAQVAARRAFEEDAFATDAGEVLARAYQSAFELGDDVAARSWCDEFERRNPRETWSTSCALQLQAWSAGPPDLAVATAKHRNFRGAEPQLDSLAHGIVDLAFAAVLARAGLRDSAQALVARASDPHRPQLLPWEAQARILLHQNGAAIQILREYLKYFPYERMAVARSRCYAALRRDTTFLTLVAGPPAVPGGPAQH